MFGIDDAALAIALGAGVTTAGSLWANSQNKKAQQQINEQALNVAALNNATQIDMANTAHQREVADLRNAGLNPILSAGGSGASVPQLHSPSLGTPTVTNPVSDVAHSAGQLSRYVGQSLSNLEADTEVKQNTAENLATQNKNLDAQNGLFKAQTLETLARAERETAEAKYPGMIGQLFRTAKNGSHEFFSKAFDTLGDVWSAGRTGLDPVTWSSPSNQARRYGTGGGSSVEVEFKPVKVPSRALHEGSKFNVPTPKSKRRHN